MQAIPWRGVALFLRSRCEYASDDGPQLASTISFPNTEAMHIRDAGSTSGACRAARGATKHRVLPC